MTSSTRRSEPVPPLAEDPFLAVGGSQVSLAQVILLFLGLDLFSICGSVTNAVMGMGAVASFVASSWILAATAFLVFGKVDGLSRGECIATRVVRALDSWRRGRS